MKAVGIAELKSRLSEHLRAVRRGASLTVLDRETPIARIVPWKRDDDLLRIRRPLSSAPMLSRIPLPPPLPFDGDIVDLLLEERREDR